MLYKRFSLNKNRLFSKILMMQNALSGVFSILRDTRWSLPCTWLVLPASSLTGLVVHSVNKVTQARLSVMLLTEFWYQANAEAKRFPFLPETRIYVGVSTPIPWLLSNYLICAVVLRRQEVVVLVSRDYYAQSYTWTMQSCYNCGYPDYTELACSWDFIGPPTSQESRSWECSSCYTTELIWSDDEEEISAPLSYFLRDDVSSLEGDRYEYFSNDPPPTWAKCLIFSCFCCTSRSLSVLSTKPPLIESNPCGFEIMKIL